MTKLKNVLLSGMVLCFFTALPVVHAQEAPGVEKSPQMHAKRFQEIFDQLNLTDDQKKQLESNKQDHRAKMERARDEIKKIKGALKDELMKAQLDMAKVNSLHNQIKVVQSQIEDDKLSSILAVRSILTPEQFTKFVNLMHQHKQEHEE